MSVIAELFVSDHAGALAYAESLSAAIMPAHRPPHAEFSGITDLEIEAFAELVGRALGADGIGYEFDLVDVSRDDLLAAPSDVVAILAEAVRTEEFDVAAVAAAWAATEEMGTDPATAGSLAQEILDLATRAFDEERELYLWTAS